MGLGFRETKGKIVVLFRTTWLVVDIKMDKLWKLMVLVLLSGLKDLTFLIGFHSDRDRLRNKLTGNLKISLIMLNGWWSA